MFYPSFICSAINGVVVPHPFHEPYIRDQHMLFLAVRRCRAAALHRMCDTAISRGTLFREYERGYKLLTRGQRHKGTVTSRSEETGRDGRVNTIRIAHQAEREMK